MSRSARDSELSASMRQTKQSAFPPNGELMIGGLDELEEFLRGVPAEVLHDRYFASPCNPATYKMSEDELVEYVARQFTSHTLWWTEPTGYTSETLASKEEFLAEVRRQARSWFDKEDIEHGLAEARLLLGGKIPSEERLNCIETLKRGRPKRPAGTYPRATEERDTLIRFLVGKVMGLSWLRATRNETSEQECACSIVACGLTKCGTTLSEKSVARIYRKASRSGTAYQVMVAIELVEDWADNVYGDNAILFVAKWLDPHAEA